MYIHCISSLWGSELCSFLTFYFLLATASIHNHIKWILIFKCVCVCLNGKNSVVLDDFFFQTSFALFLFHLCSLFEVGLLVLCICTLDTFFQVYFPRAIQFPFIQRTLIVYQSSLNSVLIHCTFAFSHFILCAHITYTASPAHTSTFP